MKYKNILQTIGNTPLVEIKKLNPNKKIVLLAKLEFMNPGGSIKDRMALQIIIDAEKSGHLKPNSTIIEATGAGNTGIGLALIGAIRGYKTILTLPDKNSQEKIDLLRAFGAKMIICPTKVAPDDQRSYYSVAKQLAEKTPNSFLANQYYNPSNPKSHYLTTGPEIWKQTKGQVTHVVLGAGTGGTISGIGKFLKEKNPQIKVIVADPKGSIYKHYFKTQKIKKILRQLFQ